MTMVRLSELAMGQQGIIEDVDAEVLFASGCKPWGFASARRCARSAKPCLADPSKSGSAASTSCCAATTPR